MLIFVKYSLLIFVVVLKIIESQLDLNFYSTLWKSEVMSQDEQLDSRLIGVWVMVLKIVDGEIEYDESIEKKYRYNFQKNGNYIIDLRALRSNEAFRNTSIVDLPHFRWQTSDGVLEISVFSGENGINPSVTDRKQYYFKGDTLVRSVSRFQYYYVRKAN